MNESVWISIKISLEYVPKGPIDNIIGWVITYPSKFKTMLVKGGPNINCSIPWLMAGVMGTAINAADVLNGEDIDRCVGFRDTSSK